MNVWITMLNGVRMLDGRHHRPPHSNAGAAKLSRNLRANPEWLSRVAAAKLSAARA
jgi:hypothetical protein